MRTLTTDSQMLAAYPNSSDSALMYASCFSRSLLMAPALISLARNTKGKRKNRHYAKTDGMWTRHQRRS